MDSKPKYRTPALQQMYAACLKGARDPASEFYFNGKPHRGAIHRCAFWDGYAGVASANNIRGTPSAAAYQAGKTFAKSKPGIPTNDAVWTVGFSRQGE